MPGWTTPARSSRRRPAPSRSRTTAGLRHRALRLGVLVVAVLAPLSASAPSSATPLSVSRSGGADRAATAVAVSESAWPSGAQVAFVARSDAHPDALAATPLAAALDAPLLLTHPDRLEKVVEDELRRLGVDEVVLLGGPSAISSQVAEQIGAALNVRVERVSGSNRFATAKAIADQLAVTTGRTADAAYVAAGSGWADALSVAPLAGRQGSPLLLADRTRLPYEDGWLQQLQQLTLVGGESVLDRNLGAGLHAIRPRLSGENRYATSLRVADVAIDELDAAGDGEASFEVWLATGTSFPDALSAGPAVAGRNAVLLLAPPRWEGSATRRWIVEHADRITGVRLLGGPGVLPDSLAADLARIDPDAPQPGAGDGYLYQLMYSTRPDRSAPKPLEGATVNGDIYVFLARCEADGQLCVTEW